MSPCTRRDLLRSGSGLLVSHFLPDRTMARLAHQFTQSHGLPSARVLEAIAPRERLLFDFDWKFFQGHGANPARDLGFGKDQEDFAKSGEFQFATDRFDDSGWRGLHLPHDWAIELPFVRDDKLQGHGYKPLGRSYPETSGGWYRRAFQFPKEDLGG